MIILHSMFTSDTYKHGIRESAQKQGAKVNNTQCNKKKNTAKICIAHYMPDDFPIHEIKFQIY